jgi:uroporphyrinogen III methyltransferase / synthase
MMALGDAATAKPLHGATIVVTRSADRAERLTGPLLALGADVISYAATRIVPCNADALAGAATSLPDYDWVIFTSATSVALLFDATEARGMSTSAWAQVRIAAVGSATAAAIRERGLEPALVPGRFVSDALLDAFAERGEMGGATVLYPAAKGARDALADGLRALGARVDRIDVYDSVATTHDDVSGLQAALQSGRIDAVTLTAKSAVDAWVMAMAPAHAVADVVSIGPITTQAAHAAGLRVAAEALPSTVDGLVAAVIRAVDARRNRIPHLTPPP